MMNMRKAEILQGNKIEISEMILRNVNNQLEMSWKISFENAFLWITFFNVSRFRIGEVSEPIVFSSHFKHWLTDLCRLEILSMSPDARCLALFDLIVI